MKTKLAVLLLTLGGLTATAGPGPECSGYVAHEWGTFTSVQAADGVQMPWNPLNVEDLPEFVYSLSWPEGKKVGRENPLAGKAGFLALQRMETPVIYFYGDGPQTVDVSVKFPHGTVTEWFPQATKANAFGERELSRRRLEQGSVTWNGVSILPKTDPSKLREDATGSHYYAARETDANLIRTKSSRGSETERFLFYRGVGSFEAPLRVKQQGDDADAIELRNEGKGALHHLLVYRVEGDRAAWTVLTGLEPAETRTVGLQFDKNAISRSVFQEQAGPGLRKALAAQGLYDREAASMVKTWEESWFAEQGIRVLYILPAEWTDETLPLALKPAPRQVARVMVGRAELVTPAMETSLLAEIIRYGGKDQGERARAVENVRKLGLGRFSEAVVRRVISRGGLTREVNNRAWELLAAVNTKEPARQLAQNTFE